MKYHVINGEVAVQSVSINYITSSSIFFVGDLRRVLLTSAFDTPPEDVIVGVPEIEE